MVQSDLITYRAAIDFLGFGTFLPVILKNGFGYTTKEAQYFVIPGTSSN